MNSIKITMKYNRKNFYGDKEYTEDSIDFSCYDNILQSAIKKSLKKVLDDYTSSFGVCGNKINYVIWQEFKDHEAQNDILTVREYNNYSSFDEYRITKKELNKKLKDILKED